MVRIRNRWLVESIKLISLVLFLQACSSVAYLPGQQTVGRLRTIGPNVFYRDEPARDGQMVKVGDHLRTGSDSSAYVFFLHGGFVQLDENTHPYFEIVWDGAQCGILNLGIRAGQLYHEAGYQCRTIVRTVHGELMQSAPQHNLFNAKVDERVSEFTLLAGDPMSLKITRSKPKFFELEPGHQVRVSAVGVEEVKRLSDLELDQVTRWRLRFPRPCAPGGGECAPAGGITAAGQCTD